VVCQGCFLTVIGITAGFFTSLAINLTLEQINWLLIAIFIVTSLLLVEAFKVTSRPIKRITRLLTGLGIGAFFWGLITIDFPTKLIGLMVALMSYGLFRLIRYLRPITDLCIGCQELNAGRVCSGLEHKAKAMREYSDYASDVLQDVMRAKYQDKLKE
jgi:hypothetical protein